MLKQKTSIKSKAAFLLMVFALNTVVGFACSMGVNMGFNSKHHGVNEVAEGVVHVHNDSKMPVHHGKSERYRHDKGLKHDQTNNQQKPERDNGRCCNDKVLKFQQLDKAVPSSVSPIHPVFLTAFVATYYNFNIFPHTDVVRDIKPFVRSYHPPIPDIRIAIRSFQI